MKRLSMHGYVLKKLHATRGTWPVVAKKSGVSKRTIEKIARREIADPGVSHVQKLFDYYRRRDAAAARRIVRRPLRREPLQVRA